MAISSSDPNAIAKLQSKLKSCVELQEKMKKANKFVRKKDKEGLTNMGFSEREIEELFKPDFCNRIGYPDYALKNNNAEIRRLKKRIEELEKVEKELKELEEIEAVDCGDYEIVYDIPENRIKLIFKNKPNQEVRDRLKLLGFKWSPTNSAWQRFYNNSSKFAVDQFKEWYKNN